MFLLCLKNPLSANYMTSVKICSRSKWPSVKNAAVKIAVGQNSRRSKLPSVKIAVGQNGRRSKMPSVKMPSVKMAVGHVSRKLFCGKNLKI
jgi:hypothetical protein